MGLSHVSHIDIEVFKTFVTNVRAKGITVPILPGIMPLNAYGGFKRMTGFCKTRIPPAMAAKVEELKDDDKKADFIAFGVDYVATLCKQARDAPTSPPPTRAPNRTPTPAPAPAPPRPALPSPWRDLAAISRPARSSSPSSAPASTSIASTSRSARTRSSTRWATSRRRRELQRECIGRAAGRRGEGSWPRAGGHASCIGAMSRARSGVQVPGRGGG